MTCLGMKIMLRNVNVGLRGLLLTTIGKLKPILKKNLCPFRQDGYTRLSVSPQSLVAISVHFCFLVTDGSAERMLLEVPFSVHLYIHMGSISVTVLSVMFLQPEMNCFIHTSIIPTLQTENNII